jgi:DtxR family Mn-dependent transcriptional regulator
MGSIEKMNWPWRTKKFQIAEDDALKHLHDFGVRQLEVTPESLAGAMRLSGESALKLLHRLESDGWIRVTEGQTHLSEKGHARAIRIVRAHRLYETFLAEKTGMAPSDWHANAEIMEHRLEPTALDALADELGNPRFDPHGDPIPTRSGSLPVRQLLRLSDCPKDFYGRVEHIEDEPASLFHTISRLGLVRGISFSILEKTDSDILMQVEDRKALIPRLSARQIQVSEDFKLEFPQENLIRLNQLKKGHSGHIAGISRQCQGMERRRLLDLGFVPGSEVILERVGPFHSPLAFRIRGTLIALRPHQANKIIIEERI